MFGITFIITKKNVEFGEFIPPGILTREYTRGVPTIISVQGTLLGGV